MGRSLRMTKPINEEKVAAALAIVVQKEKDHQAKMRRAFNAWDKVRKTVDRYEKLLEKAAAERAARASKRRVIKVKLKDPNDALPQLTDLLDPATLKKVLP